MPETRDGLACPQSFLDAPDELRRQVCNGCGSAQAKFDFIPDTVWFLPIRKACDIHDWMYAQGRDIEDKRQADRVFLNNMLRLVERERGIVGRLLKPLRRRRALKYYEAVNAFGGPAFWSGKNG
ncbi:MAG: hypothetical protein WD750_05955 [Gammaproteobacteria bacterium]